MQRGISVALWRPLAELLAKIHEDPAALLDELEAPEASPLLRLATPL